MKQVVSFILLFVFSICYGNDLLVAQTRKKRETKGKEKKIVRERRWICC
ncbi:MAG: hypothetical protein ACLU4J_08190 [Butyricimonas paravirosa]